MDTITQLPDALRKVTLGAHVLLTAWLLVNGIAHEIHVLVKASAGTLRPDHNVPSLLAVGAGLLVAGTFAALAVGPLKGASNVLPAFLSVGFLGLVLAAIAAAYGFKFLGGTITLGVIDLILLTALKARL